MAQMTGPTLIRRGRPPSNDVVLKHVGLLGGMDYLAARYRQQTFPRHFHHEYLIGIIESGVHDVWCRGDWWHAQAGWVATFAPGEPHHGGAGSEHGWSQKIFYLPEQLVREVLRDPDGGARATPAFATPFHYDPDLARRLRRLWDLLESGASELAIEERVHAVLPELFMRYGAWEHCAVTVAPAGLYQVRDYIHAHSAELIRLNDLARLARLSKGSLIASFKARFGLSPGRYLIQVRVDEAKHLLTGGTDIADVASAVGFADQSDLTRHFRAILGVTPARYIAV